MFKRRLLRILIVTALISVAIPLYQMFLQPSRPPGRGPDLFSAAVACSLIPALSIAEVVVPAEYFAITPPDGDFDRRDLVVWSVVIPANMLFWTTVLMVMSFTIDLMRRPSV
jgi:hypothetical protein